MLETKIPPPIVGLLFATTYLVACPPDAISYTGAARAYSRGDIANNRYWFCC